MRFGCGGECGGVVGFGCGGEFQGVVGFGCGVWVQGVRVIFSFFSNVGCN